MHQSDQIILKNCPYLFLEKCLCDGSTCSFKAFSFPMCNVHSHAPAARFQPSCQNASDASSPKTGGAEAGNLPREPNQYLDSFRRQNLRWLSHLAAALHPFVSKVIVCAVSRIGTREISAWGQWQVPGAWKETFPLWIWRLWEWRLCHWVITPKEVKANTCLEFLSSYTWGICWALWGAHGTVSGSASDTSSAEQLKQLPCCCLLSWWFTWSKNLCQRGRQPCCGVVWVSPRLCRVPLPGPQAGRQVKPWPSTENYFNLLSSHST